MQESEGFKKLQKTKWITLAGSTLAVLSSSALYINQVLFMFLGENGNPFYVNPYLNYSVFGINMDSMLNDVGMLLACGVLKTVSCTALAKVFSTAKARSVNPQPQQPSGEYAEPSVVFASQV